MYVYMYFSVCPVLLYRFCPFVQQRCCKAVCVDCVPQNFFDEFSSALAVLYWRSVFTLQLQPCRHQLYCTRISYFRVIFCRKTFQTKLHQQFVAANPRNDACHGWVRFKLKCGIAIQDGIFFVKCTLLLHFLVSSVRRFSRKDVFFLHCDFRERNADVFLAFDLFHSMYMCNVHVYRKMRLWWSLK